MNANDSTKRDNAVNFLEGRSVGDISSIQVSVSFPDDTGFIVPLSQIQAEHLVRMLGIRIDGEKGIFSMYSDDDIRKFIEGG